MANRPTQDVVGFTRIFVLFCTLVLLPALLLSGFGVIAIRNERQAERQRQHDDAQKELRRAEREFGDVLRKSDDEVRTALERTRGPALLAAMAAAQQRHPIGDWIVFAPPAGEGAAVDEPIGTGRLARIDPDSPLSERLAHLRATADPKQPAHATIEFPGHTVVASVQRLADDRVVIYGIDDPRVAAALARTAKGPLQAVVRISAPVDEPVQNAVDRLVQEIARARATDSSLEELALRRLEPPFDRFTLVVEGPPSPGSTPTMVLYVILLVAILDTLITGVVITARLIWHETRLSRLKTDFVSHMSHELRTPLTSIRMFIDTLRMRDSMTPEEEQECLDLLAQETTRLSDMIERVLGYARLRAGRRLFTPAAVDVRALVDDALAAFRAQNLSADNVQLRTEVAAALPATFVDRNAIVEALLNLVGNAYKYSGNDKQIAVIAKAARNGRVIIGVRDNGPGLPHSEHKRVFDRFYQSQHLLTGKQTGSGLGLAITKAIVEGNGGQVWVESEPGKGATFWMDLPSEKTSPPSSASAS